VVDWQVNRDALMHYAFVLARIRLTRMAAERGPILSGACRPGCALLHHAFVVALMQHDCILARIRLTRMAAERGPILSGACGQIVVFHRMWFPSAFRVRALAVSTGSSVSGV
jgi:hypothetical protein